MVILYLFCLVCNVYSYQRENTNIVDKEFIKFWAEKASVLERPELIEEISELISTCKSLEERHHRQDSTAITNDEKISLLKVWEKTQRPRYHNYFDKLIIYMRVAATHFKDLKYTIDDDLLYNDLDRRGDGYHTYFLETVNKFIKSDMKKTRKYRRAIGDL